MTSTKARPSPRGLALSHYGQAVRLLNLGRENDAAVALDTALREDPEFAPAFSLGAYILARAGKEETALRFYQRALELQPDLTAAWSNLGKLLFKLDRQDAALKTLNAGLRYAPHDADMHNSRAGVLRALGRLEDSAAAARAALRLRPNFPEASLNLGAAQLNATANVPGAFVYAPPAGTVLNAGNNQSLSATFTPTDAANYNSVSAGVQKRNLK